MKKKLINILSITFATLLLATPFSLPLTTITAEDTLTANSFTMQKGAAVRLVEGSNGLRFSAEISQDEYTVLKNAGAKFGMLIVAKDLLKGIEITPETVFGENSSFYFTNKTEGRVNGKIEMINVTSPSCRNIDDDANIEICGSIANILINNYTRSFIGRAYVAIPEKNAETGATTYEYHFAPYYDNNVANNTRCMYYVAQRSIEENEFVDELNELYITPFSSTDRFTKYHYAYKVLHHYIEHDDDLHATGEAAHTIVYTHEETLYAQLNSTVEAHPIIKPTTAFDGLTLDAWNEMTDDEKATTASKYQLSVALLNKFLNHHYIFDVDHKDLHRNGLVYAAGMQTFHLYYESSSTISEEHQRDTLAEVLHHFLDIDNVEEHFGIEPEENGGDWKVEQLHVYDENNQPVVNEDGEYVNHGIDFTGLQGNKSDELYITEKFFDEIRAYGVETITFTFATQRGGNKEGNIKYHIYQQEDEDHVKPLPVYYTDDNGVIQKIDAANQEVTVPRVTIYLKDITPGGGLTFNPAPAMTSNTAEFAFLNVEFGLYHDAQNL